MVSGLMIAGGVIVIAFVIAVFIGRARERASADELIKRLMKDASRPVAGRVQFDSFAGLPAPVVRYFKLALTEGQPPISKATIRQSGVLRTSTASEHWSSFDALQIVVPPATGFVWNARVEMPLVTHVRVLDGYCAGVGSGRVSLWSAFAVVAEAGGAELNAGALHRYLAEAVWFPTALLPESGITWTPIDDRNARATLTNGGATVALDFRFNEAGEVTSIYTPRRFGKFDGGYRQVPWEGHFRDYHVRAGMRIPRSGDVGWHIDGTLQTVWKGDIIEVWYEFGP
jgi:hypothetical protein